MKKVDFLIVGAQKSATTTLFNYLKKHPQVSMSLEKETHFFDKEENFIEKPDYEKYHNYFDFTEEEKIFGEATPIYMYWNDAAKRIFEYNPNMKIIISLRNPIERAYSHWQMEKIKNKENLDFYNAIQLEDKRSREALPLQHRVYSYLDRGFYINQIKKLWHFFGKDNVLILNYDELNNNHLLSLNKICNFLNIDYLNDQEIIKKNVNNYEKEITKQEYNFLLKTFKFEIKYLEKLLDWDCGDWILNYDRFISKKKKKEKLPIIFILSWNRPLYLWVCLDSIYRHTKYPCKIIIADNNSDDPLVEKIIKNFEKRGMFYKIHIFKENDPFRLKKLVDTYWEEIDDYFMFIESDIEILPLQNNNCWLEKFVSYMDNDENLGIVGSRVYKEDFVSLEKAKELKPELSEEELNFLIKVNAPMREYKDTTEKLINPHNPPLRLLMLRKKVYAQIGFGRDIEIYRKTIELGYKSKISTEIIHRHLSLLNIFDYSEYSGEHRNNFFNKQLKKNTCVVILGMHRSGTSALTGILENYGLYLGNVKTSSPFNKKGNRENPKIFRFHEKIFNENNASWNNPPNKIIWSRENIRELKEIVKEYSDYLTWGFKDPRSIFTIEKWIELFKDNLSFKFIASIREPLSVAKSLNTRSNMSIYDGLELWYYYNKKLYELCKKYPIEIVNFELEEKVYLEKVFQIAKKLELPNIINKPTFYSKELINSNLRKEEYEVPTKISDLYYNLNNLR